MTECALALWLGLGSFASRPAIAITHPGVQFPHWLPLASAIWCALSKGRGRGLVDLVQIWGCEIIHLHRL